MLFTKYDTHKPIKTNKNDLIRNINSADIFDISLIEPVDKSNLRLAKQELDKLVRTYPVSLIVVRHKR